MLEISRAKYVDGYKIRIHFSNCESGVVDLEDSLWGPVFEPLKDLKEFRKFEVSTLFHTITWKNGADFAPEYLHNKMVEQAASSGLRRVSRRSARSHAQTTI